MKRQPLQYRTYSSWRTTAPAKRHRHKFAKVTVVLLLLVVFGSATVYGLSHVRTSRSLSPKTNTTHATTTPSTTHSTQTVKVKPSVRQTAKSSECGSNTLPQLVLVSISQRHMWACAGSKQLYDSAVVTGMENLPADLTPIGTYKIYDKQTNLYLNGSDSTGSWHDYVYYWMPFLSNRYGVYGFHDATWRPSDAFGNISPYSSDASHGCVELPLATGKWLYNWAQIGTTVTIEA